MSSSLKVVQPFVVGLQLGRIQSPGALAIIERTPGLLEDSPITHELRFLQRWREGTAYPTIVRQVAALLRRAPLREPDSRLDPYRSLLPDYIRGGTAAVVVNATGVGRAALELFADEDPDLRTVATWVTTGDQALEDENGWRVPQRDLVAAVQVLQQQERLAIAALPETTVVLAQVEGFHVTAGAGGRDRYEAAAGEDEMVLAVALACWWGELVSPGRVEVESGPFSAFSQEALEYERRKRRIKSVRAKPSGPMADGIG